MSCMGEFNGPAAWLIGSGSYACDVREACGTEVFCNSRLMIEVPKHRVQSSMGPLMPVDAQPMANLAMKGSFTVSLDEDDRMEVFEGSYLDEEHGKVSVRCHVGAVYAIPKEMRKADGSVELSNGSGIAPPV